MLEKSEVKILAFNPTSLTMVATVYLKGKKACHGRHLWRKGETHEIEKYLCLEKTACYSQFLVNQNSGLTTIRALQYKEQLDCVSWKNCHCI